VSHPSAPERERLQAVGRGGGWPAQLRLLSPERPTRCRPRSGRSPGRPSRGWGVGGSSSGFKPGGRGREVRGSPQAWPGPGRARAGAACMLMSARPRHCAPAPWLRGGRERGAQERGAQHPSAPPQTPLHPPRSTHPGPGRSRAHPAGPCGRTMPAAPLRAGDVAAAAGRAEPARWC
jgi:hypothetical protein